MIDETQAKPFTPAPELVISDLETLKVLADPLRLSILEYLMRPGTVKRIAGKINKPATKLYYHFNLLEKHGLIVLVDTRIVSGIIEKHYQAAARVYRVARDLLAPGTGEFDEGLELTLNGLFNATKQEILTNMHDKTINMGDEAPWHHRMTLSQLVFALKPADLVAFHKQLTELIDTYQATSEQTDHDSADIDILKMLLVAYPISRSAIGLDDDAETAANGSH